MPLTTVPVTGFLPMPDGVLFDSATVEFRLNRPDFDTIDDASIGTSPVFVTVDGSGEVAVNLWSNTRGVKGSAYSVKMYYQGTGSYAAVEIDFGLMQVADIGGDIADFLAAGVVAGAVVVSFLTQAEYDAAIDAVADAEAAAAAALIDADRTEVNALSVIDRAWFPTVSDLTSDNNVIIGYTGSGAQFIVAAGDIIEADGLRYEVALVGATDNHTATDGPVKLYALPDTRGAITAKQVGITDGSNGTVAFTQFCASRLTGITRFICDVDFDLASPANEGFTVSTPIVIEADNADQIARGEDATRTIGLMNLISNRADANGLPRRSGMFNAAKFRGRGMRFAYDVEVTEAEIVGNGNGNAVFYDNGTGGGCFVDKCKADFLSGFLLNIIDHPYWRVTNCWAGKPFYFVYLNGRCDYGRYNENDGNMGYVDSVGTNNFGDYIKAGASGVGNIGPRYCHVFNNKFVNAYRDGVDSTGGLQGWIIEGNHFDCTIAAIDAKQSPVGATDPGRLEENYAGLTIRNNVIRGGEIIFTYNVNIANYGSTPPDFMQIHNVTSGGNVFIPRPGRENCGYYFKGVHGVSVDGDNFTAYRLENVGDFDPLADGVFPASASEGSYYVATSAATIDGLSISIGDFVVPTKDGASTTDSTEWVIRDSAWLSCTAVRFDNGTTTGYSNQGSWDASVGTFPVSTDDGQYWTVSVDGTVGGIPFKVGEFLTALVDSASTTIYDGNWVRRKGTYYLPVAYDVSFRNILWDARGGESITFNECERVSIHFANFIASRPSTIDVRSTSGDITVSGVLNAYADEFKNYPALAPCVVQGGHGVISFDLDAKYHSGINRGYAVNVTSDTNVRFDGNYENFIGAIRVQTSLTESYLGFGRGIRAIDCASLLNRNTSACRVDVGFVSLKDTPLLVNTSTSLTGTILSLKAGVGPELTISGGVIAATNAVHAVDTQSDAATDDLTTINGGQLGDRLMITAADSARTVVAKDGTGNLVLGADRTMDNVVDTLVLERRNDGNWHQVSFTDLGA